MVTVPQILKSIPSVMGMGGYFLLAGNKRIPLLFLIKYLSKNSPLTTATTILLLEGTTDLSTISSELGGIWASIIESPILRTMKVDKGLGLKDARGR